MSSSIEDILGGTLGFLWSGNDKQEPCEQVSGWIVKKDERIIIKTLVADPYSNFKESQGLGSPDCLCCLTPEGAALFLEVITTNSTVTFGAKASTRTYQARSLIKGVLFDRLKTHNVTSISARFPGTGKWAGMSAGSPSIVTDSAGRSKSFSISVSSEEGKSARLSGGRTLTIGTSWNVTGTDDRRVIYSPVTVTCSSTRPRDIWELLQPLLLVQDLLSFAFNGFVVADTGRARLDLKPAESDAPARASEFWNGALMTSQKGAMSPKSMTEHPLFRLDDIGGIQGLARWVSLATEHPRATLPAVSQYRHGATLAEVTLLNVAAGIEYWVGSHRRTTQWAKNTGKPGAKKKGGNNFAVALTRKMGAAFNGWCGDSESWADDFHETYNKLKHENKYEYEGRHLADLAASGVLLLAASLADRAGNSKKPSRSIFESYRLYNLGARLRERYVR